MTRMPGQGLPGDGLAGAGLPSQGLPEPLGVVALGRWRERRGAFGIRRAHRAVPVRCHRGRNRAREPASPHWRRVPCACARDRRGAALRTEGAWPLRAGARAAVQPFEAACRPLRDAARPAVRPAPLDVRLRRRRSVRGPVAGWAGQRAVRAEGRSWKRPTLRSRPPGRACRGIARSSTSCMCAGSRSSTLRCRRRLRGTFAGLGCAASAHSGGARRYHRRAHAGRGMGQRAPFGPARALEHWGYNPITLLAPDPRLAPGGWPEVRAAVAALQAAGIEVIARRRAQPYRRGRRAGADAVACAGSTTPPITAEAGRAAPLYRRRRLRQYAGSGPAAGAAARDGRAARLGGQRPGSTASASISRRRWAGVPRASTPPRRCCRRSRRIRCCAS